MPRARLVAALLLVTLAACKGPAVPNPFAGQSRYLCCNTFYEKSKITDVNYHRGTMIPFGTRVEILEVRKNTVKFQPAGHPPLELVLRYGRKDLTMDQYLDRLFLADDPHSRLRRASGKGGKTGKGGKAAPDTSGAINGAIERAEVVDGMTRDEVLMSVGYPPAHRTPSLESPTWTYWENAWANYYVTFENDRVARVAR